MSDKRIKLSGAAYKKAAKEKLEKTDNLLRKIPKLHSYFAATNPEKTESELKKNSPKKIDKIESCLAVAYEIQSNQIDVQIDNKNAEEATSTNEQQVIESEFYIMKKKNNSYPKAVWYIFGNELCERFSYYGLKAILVLFFTTVQKYDRDTSTVIIHMFIVFQSVSALFGAIIADSYWGKYRTIFILSIVHALGNIIVAISSLVTSVSIHFQRLFTIIGLVLTSIGAGGIRPCVAAFGGEQFVMPDQEDCLQMYFSIFYFTVNLGSLLSTSITPELRKSVQCFGKDSCFPLAFGVPALLMMISIVFFVSAKDMYTIIKPTFSIITTSIGCIFYALKKKITASSNEVKRKDWLEYADDKYNALEISDLRSALDVMYLLIPVPLFYTLLDQQSSRWILQGTLMNGKIDFLNWIIKPDQIHLINPLFVLIFIPVFNVIYPLLYKIGITTAFRKIILGGMFAAISFVCAAFVQYAIIGQTFSMPSIGGQLRIYNSFDCNVAISGSLVGNFSVEKLDVLHINYNSTALNETDVLFIDLDPLCKLKTNTLKQHVFIDKGMVSSYLLTSTNNVDIELKHLNEFKKLKNGNSNLRILHNNFSVKNITLRDTNNKLSGISFKFSTNQDTNYELPVGIYDIYLDNEPILQNVEFLPVSINDLLFHHYVNHTNAKLITLEKGKYIHILWQVPQTILISIAEVMSLITLMEFAFTQAPSSMKSFLSAANLCTVAVGNLLVVIISKIGLFENQGHEFLFYAVLMVLDMILLIFMSTKYKYKSVHTQ
ncbi:solute carrier family 15 member 1-like [Myzus persicae]|uniref:solute carrier family 15 member 1-like n=1 Tax=Myzus persicae TaxID=13164 RepID=UPI000B939266|nr:solute carrier family 15 member 1-like [Myzus persicae]